MCWSPAIQRDKVDKLEAVELPYTDRVKGLGLTGRRVYCREVESMHRCVSNGPANRLVVLGQMALEHSTTDQTMVEVWCL